ncbi:MAG: S49 family peptidase, partial [Burkholderiales bacterium]|nr:S49 family peptidase [Burkholderiales bacterium]
MKPTDASWERQTLEKLAFAMLAEQQAARRWKSFWRVVWLAVLGVGVWMAMSKTPSSTPSALPHT